MTEDSYKSAKGLYPDADDPLLEYVFTGYGFYRTLLLFRGMMLHASAVELDGKAYLFSAPSGTGKSTHTALWLKKFPGKARILNDDKPALRLEKDGVFVYGTPWSGKTDLNLNHRVRLGGVCFLRRAENNSIRKLPTDMAIQELLQQTVRPREQDLISNLLDVISDLLKEYPVFELHCNMEPEAADLSYRTLSCGGHI